MGREEVRCRTWLRTLLVLLAALVLVPAAAAWAQDTMGEAADSAMQDDPAGYDPSGSEASTPATEPAKSPGRADVLRRCRADACFPCRPDEWRDLGGGR